MHGSWLAEVYRMCL